MLYYCVTFLPEMLETVSPAGAGRGQIWRCRSCSPGVAASWPRTWSLWSGTPCVSWRTWTYQDDNKVFIWDFCSVIIPQRPAGGGLKGRILLLDEREPVVLQVLGVDGEVLVIPRQDPLDNLVIVGVPELDLEPLGPPLEPAVGALHVGVAIGEVELSGLGLDVARLGSVTTCLPEGQDNVNTQDTQLYTEQMNVFMLGRFSKWVSFLKKLFLPRSLVFLPHECKS